MDFIPYHPYLIDKFFDILISVYKINNYEPPEQNNPSLSDEYVKKIFEIHKEKDWRKFKNLFNDIKILPFGGISENTQLFKILSLSNISGVCISNFLSYTEHSIQKYKLFLEKKKIDCIRPPEFEKNFI